MIQQNQMVMLKKGALHIRSINHKLRQRILSLIEERKEIKVTDIYVTLHLEQSVASQHLAILRKSGVVTTRREGKAIWYSVNHKRVNDIINLSKELDG